MIALGLLPRSETKIMRGPPGGGPTHQSTTEKRALRSEGLDKKEISCELQLSSYNVEKVEDLVNRERHLKFNQSTKLGFAIIGWVELSKVRA